MFNDPIVCFNIIMLNEWETETLNDCGVYSTSDQSTAQPE